MTKPCFKTWDPILGQNPIIHHLLFEVVSSNMQWKNLSNLTDMKQHTEKKSSRLEILTMMDHEKKVQREPAIQALYNWQSPSKDGKGGDRCDGCQWKDKSFIAATARCPLLHIPFFSDITDYYANNSLKKSNIIACAIVGYPEALIVLQDFCQQCSLVSPYKNLNHLCSHEQ